MKVVLALFAIAWAGFLASRQVGEPAKPTFHVDSVALQYVGQTQVPATVIDASFQGNTMRLMCEPVAIRRTPQPDSGQMSRAQ